MLGTLTQSPLSPGQVGKPQLHLGWSPPPRPKCNPPSSTVLVLQCPSSWERRGEGPHLSLGTKARPWTQVPVPLPRLRMAAHRDREGWPWSRPIHCDGGSPAPCLASPREHVSAHGTAVPHTHPHTPCTRTCTHLHTAVHIHRGPPLLPRREALQAVRKESSSELVAPPSPLPALLRTPLGEGVGEPQAECREGPSPPSAGDGTESESGRSWGLSRAAPLGGAARPRRLGRPWRSGPSARQAAQEGARTPGQAAWAGGLGCLPTSQTNCLDVDRQNQCPRVEMWKAGPQESLRSTVNRGSLGCRCPAFHVLGHDSVCPQGPPADPMLASPPPARPAHRAISLDPDSPAAEGPTCNL